MWFKTLSIPPPRKGFFLRPPPPPKLSGNYHQASYIYLNFWAFKTPPPPPPRNFQPLLWEEYEYFLELHNMLCKNIECKCFKLKRIISSHTTGVYLTFSLILNSSVGWPPKAAISPRSLLLGTFCHPGETSQAARNKESRLFYQATVWFLLHPTQITLVYIS